VAPHPVPYHSSLFRALAGDPRLEVTVLYLDTIGLDPWYDPELAAVLEWDVPLVEGFPHRFLKNLSPFRSRPYVKRINPGVVRHLLFGPYDAVLVFGYSTLSAQLALWAAKLGGKAVLLKEEADLGFACGRGWKAVLKRALLPAILRRFDGVLYSCRKNREFFEHFGVSTDRLFPVLSSVDNPFLNELRSGAVELRRSVRERHGIGSRAVVALSVARLVPWKRPLDLLAAHEILAADHPDLWLVLVGDGPLRTEVENRILSRGLDRVVLTGFQNARATYAHFAAADVFLLPSERDATPKALNEAMVFGLPAVVSNRVGTADDLVVHGLNGFVHESGDVEALAGHLRTLITDRARRATMRRAALAAARVWSPQENVEGVVSALEDRG